jgi:hypothetical protein
MPNAFGNPFFAAMGPMNQQFGSFTASGGLAAQQQGAFEHLPEFLTCDHVLYSAMLDNAQHSVMARTDLWVVSPDEADDVREYRRKEWALGHPWKNVGRY